MPIFAADKGRAAVAIFNARTEVEAAATSMEQWFQSIFLDQLDESATGTTLALAPVIRVADESEMSRWWAHQRESGKHHIGHGGDVVVVVLRRSK